MTVNNPDAVPSPSPISSTFYDKLKDSALLLLPAIGALYFTVATIWGLPAKEEIVGTIAALNTFLGVVVKILNVKYNNSDAKYDGVLNVVQPEDGPAQASLDLKNFEHPADVVQQKEVLFKVNDVS